MPCGLGKKITHVGLIVILPLSSVVSPPHSPVLRSTWWPRFLICPSPLNQDRPCSPLAATPAPRAGRRMQRPFSAKLITTHLSALHLPKSLSLSFIYSCLRTNVICIHMLIPYFYFIGLCVGRRDKSAWLNKSIINDSVQITCESA